VNETDRVLRARQTEISPLAGERRMNAAVPMRSNLLRLEHELQTVVDGSALAAAITLSAHGIGDAASAAHRCRHAPHGKLRLPSSFKGIRLANSSASGRRVLAPERIESGVRLAPAIGSHRGGRAGRPDGTQPEPLTVSLLFLRPRVRNWQAACCFACRRSLYGRPVPIVRAPPM
jgi:hypothetical protein